MISSSHRGGVLPHYEVSIPHVSLRESNQMKTSPLIVSNAERIDGFHMKVTSCRLPLPNGSRKGSASNPYLMEALRAQYTEEMWALSSATTLKIQPSDLQFFGRVFCREHLKEAN